MKKENERENRGEKERAGENSPGMWLLLKKSEKHGNNWLGLFSFLSLNRLVCPVQLPCVLSCSVVSNSLQPQGP